VPGTAPDVFFHPSIGLFNRLDMNDLRPMNRARRAASPRTPRKSPAKPSRRPVRAGRTLAGMTLRQSPSRGLGSGTLRSLAGLALTALGTLAAASCGPSSPAVEGGGPGIPPLGPLRVGLEAKYPPFESKTAAGKLEGLDVDLAEAIGKHVGREVTFSDMDFDALIPELQAGRLDFVCSAVSRTPERAVVVDFSLPYVKVPMGVLGSSTLVPEGKGVEALAEDGVSIAVQRGTSGEKKAAEKFPRAKLVQFATEADAATEVAAGRAHAFVYDLVSVVKQHDQHAETTRILDRALGTEEYAIAFPKGSALRAEVDAFLAEARKPGGAVHAVFGRWRAELDALFVQTE